jgi:hypothetical protein
MPPLWAAVLGCQRVAVAVVASMVPIGTMRPLKDDPVGYLVRSAYFVKIAVNLFTSARSDVTSAFL